MDHNGSKLIKFFKMDKKGSNWIKINQNVIKQMKMDRIGSKWI